MKQLTQADLEERINSGAKAYVAPNHKQLKKADALDSLAKNLARIAQGIRQDNQSQGDTLSQQMQQSSELMQSLLNQLIGLMITEKPKSSYRFSIKRDKRGLIQSVEATPLKGA